MSGREIWVPGTARRKFAEVEPHPTKAFITPDGRRFQDNVVTLTPEQADKLWAGYMCAACLEPLTEAYPKVCPMLGCGFPVRQLQRKLLERDFLGEDPTVVGSFPMDREMEYLERKHSKPKGLMTVPKEIK